MTLGRDSSLKLCDISCLRPTQPRLLVQLYEVARIMEEASSIIYKDKANSMRQLYTRAEGLHKQLRLFAEANNIGISYLDRVQKTSEAVESAMLHSCRLRLFPKGSYMINQLTIHV